MPKGDVKAIKAMVAVLDAIVDAVGSAGEHGAPSGVVYAGLVGIMPLQTYDMVIDALVRSGRIRKEGVLLFKA